MRADQVVRLAALMREAYYTKLGAIIQPWERLTDAQKLPWMVRAHNESSLTEGNHDR